MKKMIWLIVIVFISVSKVNAQFTVQGKVFDKYTRESIHGALVSATNVSVKVVTASNGSFLLQSENKIDSIKVSFIGYETKTVAVNQETINVELETSVNSLEEVVITASRDAQVRADVPMAIHKLSPVTINDAKPTLITELINKVPGVAMLNYNNEQHGMSIRQPMGTSAYFLYMEDGIPLRPMGVFNHNALIEMNIFAISNIEVIKGPASSLYGPEAVGGGINFITQKPTAVLISRIGLQFDQWGYKRVQYGAGGMITKKLGFYVGGFYAKQNPGWMTYSDYDKNSVNARFEYNLGSKTKLILAGAFNDYYSQTPGSVDSISFYNRTYVSSSKFTYREVNSLRARLSVEHTWNENNNTFLHVFHRDNTIAQNPSYAIRWTSGQTTARGEINDNSFTSKGFILQHTANIPSIRTRIIGGISLDYSPADYDAYQIDLFAALRPGGTSVEEFTIDKERPDIKIADYDAKLLNNAAYLQLEVKPVKKVTITLGGRYDDMSFSYQNHLDTTTGKKSYQQFTPKAGIVFKILPEAGIYANYSIGFSPPGLTSVFRKKPNTNPAEFYYNLEPAKFTNYEVGGWVSLLKNTLSIDFSVYQMIGENELLSIRQPDNSTDYQSAGKTLHQGIEYGITWKPVTDVMFRFGGTNSIHRFEEFVLSTKPTDLVKDVNGKIMPSSPSFIANSEVMYKPRYIKNFKIGLEWQYMSKWYQNQVNTVVYDEKGAFGLKGISVLNFRTGYEWKGIEIFVNVMNLTDELYAFQATRGNASTNTTTYTPAPPRTFVFGVQYNFKGKK